MKTALLMILLIVSSCATNKAHRMYQGEYLPKDKVAILRDTTHYFVTAFCETRFWIVNGVDVRGKRTLEMLPGSHEVSFTIGYDSFSSKSRSGSFKFQAEAGHVYRLNVTNCMRTHRFEPWIEDETTGMVVAGTKPEKVKEDSTSTSDR